MIIYKAEIILNGKIWLKLCYMESMEIKVDKI